jgi:hypothetical protein
LGFFIVGGFNTSGSNEPELESDYLQHLLVDQEQHKFALGGAEWEGKHSLDGRCQEQRPVRPTISRKLKQQLKAPKRQECFQLELSSRARRQRELRHQILNQRIDDEGGNAVKFQPNFSPNFASAVAQYQQPDCRQFGSGLRRHHLQTAAGNQNQNYSSTVRDLQTLK